MPSLATGLDIRASVDKTRITLDESLHLVVTLSDGEGTVDTSPITDFRVISKSTSTSIQMINSSFNRSVNYSYTLVPTREGQLVIPALPVTSDGITHKTRPISIQVSKTAPSGGAANRDVFVTAEVSNDSPYVGQLMTYTFRFHYAVSISNARLEKPSFAGFNAREVEENRTYTTIISGREYNVTEVTYVLIPMKAGSLSIDAAVLNCEVVARRGNSSRNFPFDSIFNDPFFSGGQLEPRSLSSEPVSVTVQALPAYKGDIPFSGLVGTFSLKAELENPVISVGDSSTLSLTIEGAGNIMDAEEPRIAIADAFKIYSDSPEENITFSRNGYSGKKTFRKALVAVRPGVYTIEPVRMSFFDANDRSYKILSTDPIRITANPSGEKETSALSASPAPEPLPELKKKKVEFTGRDILPLKTELDALDDNTWLSIYPFVICLLIPMGCFAAVKLYCVVTGKSDDPKRVMAERAEQMLRKASGLQDDPEQFLSCLYKALVSGVCSKAGSKGESLTYLEAEQFLTAAGCDKELASRASILLKDIESARYGGGKPDDTFQNRLLEEVRQLVGSLV